MSGLDLLASVVETSSVESLCSTLGKESVSSLRKIATQSGIRGSSRLNKQELCHALGEKMKMIISTVNIDEVPSELLDPVSLMPLTDAVSASDGMFYNGNTFKKLFEPPNNGRSPITRKQLNPTAYPNTVMKNLVRDWLLEYGSSEEIITSKKESSLQTLIASMRIKLTGSKIIVPIPMKKLSSNIPDEIITNDYTPDMKQIVLNYTIQTTDTRIQGPVKVPRWYSAYHESSRFNSLTDQELLLIIPANSPLNYNYLGNERQKWEKLNELVKLVSLAVINKSYQFTENYLVPGSNIPDVAFAVKIPGVERTLVLLLTANGLPALPPLNTL